MLMKIFINGVMIVIAIGTDVFESFWHLWIPFVDYQEDCFSFQVQPSEVKNGKKSNHIKPCQLPV